MGHPCCMILWITVSFLFPQTTHQIDIMAVIRNVRSTLNVLTKMKNGFNLDLSSGCGDISSPDGRPVHESLVAHRRALLTEESVSNSIEMVQPAGEILWVHQMGKQVVQKVPDTALLGVLVIVAAELLRRGVNANRDTLPPVVRDFAETTILELDMKLETLSALDWKVDPFFQAELENLGSQPLEVIDRFIVAQILPLVDKDFAPFLLKYMTGDTERIKTVTTNVKDLIELAVEILKIERVASLQQTKSSIIKQVDLVGDNIEEVVNDWNSKIASFAGSISTFLNTGSVKSLLTEWLLIPPPRQPSSSMRYISSISSSSSSNTSASSSSSSSSSSAIGNTGSSNNNNNNSSSSGSSSMSFSQIPWLTGGSSNNNNNNNNNHNKVMTIGKNINSPNGVKKTLMWNKKTPFRLYEVIESTGRVSDEESIEQHTTSINNINNSKTPKISVNSNITTTTITTTNNNGKTKTPIISVNSSNTDSNNTNQIYYVDVDQFQNYDR